MNEGPKEFGALNGDSDEFVLPKAPPLPRPTGSPQSAPCQQADQALPSAEEVAGDDVPAPVMPATSQDYRRKIPPRRPHSPPVQEVRLNESPHAETSEVDRENPPVGSTHDSETGRNGLIGVILILLLVIVGLLVFICQIQSPQQATTEPVVSTPEEVGEEVNELRRENESISRQLVDMTAENRNLKEQVKTLSNARDNAVSELGRARDASGKESTAVRAEVSRLETLARNARPPQETASNALEPIPETQGAGMVYRVSGLREGDTLNVRSGPGSKYSVVTQLNLGVRVKVTGAGVANGADRWLPCFLSGQVADPATGDSKPWIAKGWINSAFLEEDG